MKRTIYLVLIMSCLALAAQSEPNKPNEPNVINKASEPNEPNNLNLPNEPNEPNTPAPVPTKKPSLKSIKDCVQLSKRAGDLIQDSKFEEAFDLVRSYNYYVKSVQNPDEKKVFLTNLNAMLNSVLPSIGKQLVDGFEYIGVLRFNKSEIGVYFLSKHQSAGVVWKFTFYKPEDEWKFCNFGFGPEFVSEVIMLAKPVDVNSEAADNQNGL